MGIKIHEPSVQASLIIAGTTIFTVILGFLCKDYWIPGMIENRTKKKESQYLFIQYRNSLFNSSQSFLRRLHEIYVTRSHYLWKETPMSSFYEYKYKSSVYRLCVLLGWIRAYRLIESSLKLKQLKNLQQISSAINKVESYFADGQGVEMYVVKVICKLCKIDDTKLQKDVLVKFSVNLDDLVQTFHQKHSVEYIADLLPEIKEDFILKLIDLMVELGISIKEVEKNKSEIIKEVSVKLALIYRDWQQAIGDLMLTDSKDQIAKIITFRNFERMWSMSKEAEEKIWLNRAEKIFENLDLRVDKNSDSRIDQLTFVYESIYHLMNQLYTVDIGDKPISIDDFNSISKTIPSQPILPRV